MLDTQVLMTRMNMCGQVRLYRLAFLSTCEVFCIEADLATAVYVPWGYGFRATMMAKARVIAGGLLKGIDRMSLLSRRL